MSLDPELETFLELAALGRINGKNKPMHTLSVTEARTVFEQTSLVLDPNPPQSITVTALCIPTRDGDDIHARLYRKANKADTVLPVILYFHGGGYVVGSLDSHDSVYRRLADGGEFAVLAPSYRLAPEHRWPVAINDALDSANWLCAQAAALKLDCTRVTVAGDSVGATLATVLAITATNHQDWIDLQPMSQLLFYPVTDTTSLRPSHKDYGEGYLLENETLQWFYQHYVEIDQRDHWTISPLLIPDLPTLPPAYIGLAKFDPLHDEGKAYAERLYANGTRVQLVVESALTHDYLRMGGIVGEINDIYRASIRWIVANSNERNPCFVGKKV